MNKFIMTAAFSFLLSITPCSSTVADASTASISSANCSPDFLDMSTAYSQCRTFKSGFTVHVFSGPHIQNTRPILYLTGGPGVLVNNQLGRFKSLSQRLKRPVIAPAFADSLKHLDCRKDSTSEAVWGIAPEPENAIIFEKAERRAELDRCLAHLIVQGNITKVPTTQEQAEVLVELRKQLGLVRWDIFAESYGARIALEIVKADERPIGVLVLDSPDTPWIESYWHTGENFFRAMRALGRLCRKNFYCPAKRLRLEKSLFSAISNHDVRTSPPLPLKNIRTGQIAAYARPTREQLLISSFHALRSPSRATTLPYIAAARSTTDLQGRFGLLLDQLLSTGNSLNVGMHHAIRCRELPLDDWYKALGEDKIKYPALRPLLDFLEWRQRYVCAALKIQPSETKTEPMPLNKTPTLILSGQLDPVTPPEIVAEAYAGDFLKGHLIYRSLGHVVHPQKDCVLDDIEAFLNDPQIKIQRSSCKKSDLKLRFFSPVVVR